jgi:hypothetical protein
MGVMTMGSLAQLRISVSIIIPRMVSVVCFISAWFYIAKLGKNMSRAKEIAISSPKTCL